MGRPKGSWNNSPTCKRGHNLSETRRRHPNGRTDCVACCAVRKMANIEKRRAQDRVRYRTQSDERKERRRQLDRERYAANPEKFRGKERERKYRLVYGIDSKQYKNALTAQDGVCAVCGEASNDRPLSVDHDHTTGRARGLLCTCCNVGVGMFRDSPELLVTAAAYLHIHKRPHNTQGAAAA